MKKVNGPFPKVLVRVEQKLGKGDLEAAEVAPSEGNRATPHHQVLAATFTHATKGTGAIAARCRMHQVVNARVQIREAKVPWPRCGSDRPGGALRVSTAW